MKKKIIAEIDENGYLLDKSGSSTSIIISGWEFEEYEGQNKTDALEFVKLGVSPDDLIKMKANDLI